MSKNDWNAMAEGEPEVMMRMLLTFSDKELVSGVHAYCEELFPELKGEMNEESDKKWKKVGAKKPYWMKTVTGFKLDKGNGFDVKGDWVNEEDLGDMKEGTLVQVGWTDPSGKHVILCLIDHCGCADVGGKSINSLHRIAGFDGVGYWAESEGFMDRDYFESEFPEFLEVNDKYRPVFVELKKRGMEL